MSLMCGHIQTVMGQSLRMEIGLYVYIGMINKEETWNFFQLEAKIEEWSEKHLNSNVYNFFLIYNYLLIKS